MKPPRSETPHPAALRHGAFPVDAETVLRQVDDTLAILHALEEGALLAEPPCGREARRRHQSAVVLIEVVREKLEGVRAALTALDARSLEKASIRRETSPALLRTAPPG